MITLDLQQYEETDSVWSFMPFSKPSLHKKTTLIRKLQTSGSYLKNDNLLFNMRPVSVAYFRKPLTVI